MTPSVIAQTVYSVSIDTSAVSGTAGVLAFDLTSNDGGMNQVIILNFSTDGVLGLPETEGGLVAGDLILGLNPAPLTRIHDKFFFNALGVRFMSFGTKIAFTLQLSQNPPDPSQLPDEFALYLLDVSELPLFGTSDHLGSNALFSICITGEAQGRLNVFSPTVLQPPSTLAIVVPAAVIQVAIDIKPGSFPNSINPASRGVIPVAVLTTASFDARTVDAASVRFGPGGAREAHNRGHLKDVDGDGDLDMVLHFNTGETGIECGQTEASLTGQTLGGKAIQGSDSIQTIGCK